MTITQPTRIGVMKLVLVASDVRLAVAVRSGIGMMGATVHWVASGAEVEPALRSGQCNCAVIEEVLPDMDADEVVRRVRQSGCRHPVVAIAATEQVQTRVRLLDRGADDVLAKPVHVGELAARLRALLRRSGVLAAEDPELRHGQLRMMLASRTVLDNGGVVPLTNKEFALLEALLRGKGQVLSREKLEQALHGQWKDNGSNPLEVHIHHLRRKLGGQLIRTVRRVGYTLGSEIFGSNGAAFTAGLSSCDPHTRPRA